MRPFLIAICVAVVFLLSSCLTNKGSFVLINKAKDTISQGFVTVCGQTIELKDIQPNKSMSGTYAVKSDSHYDIKVEFLSGKKISKQLGYVTNGLDFHDEFVVTDTDIDMKPK
jgi:hypothetical protein